MDRRDPLTEWRSIPDLVRTRVGGVPAAELDAARPDDLPLRVLVHHVAEANVVAAAIVTAALGAPGSTFDWSWMLPFGGWIERLDYARKPIGPSLALIDALNAWVAAQIEPLPDALQRPVRLVDQPGAEPRPSTVADVLLAEVDHAREHFGPR